MNGPLYFTGGYCILTAIFLFVFFEETNFDRTALPPAEGTTLSRVPERRPSHDEEKEVTIAEVHEARRHSVHVKERLSPPGPAPAPSSASTSRRTRGASCGAAPSSPSRSSRCPP
jgi:hypothetical protein